MWRGKWTEELESLYDAYEEKFNYPPDEYEKRSVIYNSLGRYLIFELE